MTKDLAPYMAGSCEPWTVDVLRALILAHQPFATLELGTFEGRTTRELVQVIPANTPFTTVERDYARFMAAQKHVGAGWAPLVEFVQADAIAYLETCLRDGLTYDFVFVDDDHTYAHVEEELHLLREIVPEGGLIVMHDVIGPFGLDQLAREYGGIIIDLPLLHAAGGLAVIRV